MTPSDPHRATYRLTVACLRTGWSPNDSSRRFNRRDVGPLADAVHDSLAALNEWLPLAHPGYRREDAANYVRDSLAAWKDGRATITPFGARTTAADTWGYPIWPSHG